MDEKAFRQKVSEVIDLLMLKLDSIDPDLVECTSASGVLTLLFSDSSKCILSSQPAVKQIWLAIASSGLAYHFNWDQEQGKWIDDKGQDKELQSVILSHVSLKTGLKLG